MCSLPTPRPLAEGSTPVVGLTCVTLAGPDMRGGAHYALPNQYAGCVVEAGGLPLALPNVRPEAAAAFLSRIDALVLTGGWDVDPEAYGSEPVPELGLLEQDRDHLELALTRGAHGQGIPILAICRGVQLLNVAMGGTLIQHIPNQIAKPLRHEQKDVRPDALSHSVDIEPGTCLEKIAGATRARVNTFHHQAVDRVAEGFLVSARAPDGVIEGIEDPDHPFCVGVQWHPERRPGDPLTLGLFHRLVEAAVRMPAR